jgi:hypothetical protein
MFNGVIGVIPINVNNTQNITTLFPSSPSKNPRNAGPGAVSTHPATAIHVGPNLSDNLPTNGLAGAATAIVRKPNQSEGGCSETLASRK